MVRKTSNEEHRDGPPFPTSPTQSSPSPSANDYGLLELNHETGEPRRDLKISPASAFKRTPSTCNIVRGKRHSKEELENGSLHAPPPLVLAGDDEEQEEENLDDGHGHGHKKSHSARSSNHEQVKQHHQLDDQEVALCNSPPSVHVHDGVEQESDNNHESSCNIDGDDNDNDDDSKRRLANLPKLCAMLKDVEWIGLFSSLRDLESIDTSNASDFDRVMSCTNEDLETPLHTVCWKGPPKLALLMLETIPVEQRNEFLLKQDISGNTPLHLACANLDQKVDFTVIKNLLLLAPEALDHSNTFGDSPLHLLVTSPGFQRSVTEYDFSVEAAAEEAITSLLSMVGHLATVQNQSGLTLLHCAIAHGVHERVLVKLLSISPMTARIPDNRGMLPLHFVAAFGGKHGGTPWTFVSQLIEAYEHGVIAQTENGDTALHLLLSNAAKRLGSEGEGGFLNRNSTKLAELLVTSNTGDPRVSPLLIKNKVDLAPLHCCALFDTPAQLTSIIMASPLAEQASAITTRFGATAVHLACASSRPDANIEALATRLACSTRDDKGRTPLVVAVQNEKMHGNLIKALVAAYPDAIDHPVRNAHYLPLHLAIKSHAKESVIRNLLKASPSSIQATTKAGNTALHVACHQSGVSSSIVKLLLDRYRDASWQTNHAGELPIDLANKHKSNRSLARKVPGLAPGAKNHHNHHAAASSSNHKALSATHNRRRHSHRSSTKTTNNTSISSRGDGGGGSTITSAKSAKSSSTENSTDEDGSSTNATKVSALTEPSRFEC